MDVTTPDRAVHHFFVAPGPIWSGHTLLIVHHIIGWLLVATAVAFVLVPDHSKRPGDRGAPNRTRGLPARAVAVAVAVAIVLIVVLGYGSPASAAGPAPTAARASADLMGSGSGFEALPGPALAVGFGLCFVGALLVIAVVRFAVGTASAVISEVGKSLLPALFLTLTIMLVIVAARR